MILKQICTEHIWFTSQSLHSLFSLATLFVKDCWKNHHQFQLSIHFHKEISINFFMVFNVIFYLFCKLKWRIFMMLWFITICEGFIFLRNSNPDSSLLLLQIVVLIETSPLFTNLLPATSAQREESKTQMKL